MQIHHKDGDKLNNELSNLSLLCCNCHALTDNWCGRNKDNGRRQFEDYTTEEITNAIVSHVNVHQTLTYLNLSRSQPNYNKLYAFKAKNNLLFLNEDVPLEK